MTEDIRKQTETMAWASSAFKEPWERMVDLFARMKRGEKVTRAESFIRFPFIPFPIPGRLVYHLLKNGGTRLLFGRNGSLFTIVTSSDERRIIFASVEYEDMGVYVEFHLLAHRLGENWAQDVADLLRRNDMVSAFYYLKDFVAMDERLSHINIGVLKVANVNFFREFMEAWDRSGRGRNPLLFVPLAEEAVKKILSEGWLRFYPGVNLSRLLKLISTLLRGLSPANRLLIKTSSYLPIAKSSFEPQG